MEAGEIQEGSLVPFYSELFHRGRRREGEKGGRYRWDGGEMQEGQRRKEEEVFDVDLHVVEVLKIIQLRSDQGCCSFVELLRQHQVIGFGVPLPFHNE